MALVTKIDRIRKEKAKVHTPTECELSVFVLEGEPYLQLDTFGSKQRQDRGTISQTIQFDRDAMRQLRAFIDEALASSKS